MLIFTRIGIIYTNAKLEFDRGVTTLRQTVDRAGENKLVAMNHSLSGPRVHPDVNANNLST
jgi:hypothetical protein